MQSYIGLIVFEHVCGRFSAVVRLHQISVEVCDSVMQKQFIACGLLLTVIVS